MLRAYFRTIFSYFSLPPMNAFKTIGLALALSTVSVSSAFAMSLPQKMEPVNGFTKGENPEWSMINTGSKDFDAAHRAYQKDAEALRLVWLKNNAKEIGTPAYQKAYRGYVQQRNLKHRQWIMNQASSLKAGAGMLHFTIPTVFSTDFTITVVTVPTVNITADRVLVGTAPTRRAIIMAAEARQKMHSLMIGNR